MSPWQNGEKVSFDLFLPEDASLWPAGKGSAGDNNLTCVIFH
jgi:hypothetical protein